MNNAGNVVWITGLSGSGKTTLARALQKHWPHAILLDGDELRDVFAPIAGGFDAESRRKLALTYARLAAMLAAQGHTVLVATISLFHAVHAFNRANIADYLEIFMDVPAAVRAGRDPKGLYALEKAGQIDNMAGSAVAAEFPQAPHLRFCGQEPLAECVAKVLAARSAMQSADG